MIKFPNQTFGPVFLLASNIIFGHTLVSAAPFYQTQQTIGAANDTYQMNAFNNEDDIYGMDGEGFFIYHHGVFEPLPVQGAPEITALGSAPIAMNNVDADGMVTLVGEAYVDATNSDGSGIVQRGAFWLVPADTTAPIVERTMTNGPLSNGDEAPTGFADAVNDSGVAAGSGFWLPTGNHSVGDYGYEDAVAGNYGGLPLGYVLGIDNENNYLVQDWSWDVGGETHSAALVGPLGGELPDVDSAYGTNAEPSMIYGGFVIGFYWGPEPRALGGSTERAFVWHLGDTRLTELPDPAGQSTNSQAAEALSVNDHGDVVGWASFGNYTVDVLWKRNTAGGYTAYALPDIVPDQYLALWEQYGENTIMINDNDEIALQVRTEQNSRNITILAPTGGIITTSCSNPVDQASGFAAVDVSLQRSDGFTGSVKVQYATSDGAAVAGVRYQAVQGTLIWNNGDSPDKTVLVPLIAIHTGVPEEDFNFTLSNPSNAAFGEFGASSNLDIYIADDGGLFSYLNVNNSVADDWTNVTLTLNRTGGTDGAAVIAYETFDGDAVAGTDYLATNGFVAWASGDASSKQFTVPIIQRGASAANASFYIYAYVQSADSGAAEMGEGQATVTITRPGHPVAPTIQQMTASPLGVSLQLEATQGGDFQIQTTGNLGWQTTLILDHFTNILGNVFVPISVTSGSRGFIRLIAK